MDNEFHTEKDIDCVNFAPMFAFLDEKGIDSTRILLEMGMSRDLLSKQGNMISWRISSRILELVKELLKENDPRIFYYIGRESTRLGSLGFLMDMGRKMGTIERAVRFIPRFNSKFNDIFNMTVYNVTKDSAIVVVQYKNKPRYKKL